MNRKRLGEGRGNFWGGYRSDNGRVGHKGGEPAQTSGGALKPLWALKKEKKNRGRLTDGGDSGRVRE